MIRITDYKEKYKQLEKENDNVYLIRWDYEDDKVVDPETGAESESPLGTWTYERLYYTPSIDAIQNMIDLGLTKEQILKKYSPEEYEKALNSMPVKA